MTIPVNDTCEMTMSEWYVNYLLRYMKMIEHPRFSKEKRDQYWFKLIEWQDNWNSNMQ